jgi:hypothetical protein
MEWTATIRPWLGGGKLFAHSKVLSLERLGKIIQELATPAGHYPI